MPELFREDDLLAYIRESARALGPHVKTGPGDDLAVLDLQGRLVLVGVDQVVEGVHFAKGTNPELVGRKAVTRNVSDVAAMAARPLACLAACTLPPHFDPSYARRLVDGVCRTAMQYNAPLVGGDTGIHRGQGPLMLSVTILAEPISTVHPPVLRSGGKADDRLYVTGTLGGSLRPDGTGHHLDFEPRLDEAAALASSLGANLHAMMDLSDGLAQDAWRMAVASNVQIVIDVAALPCNAGCGWHEAVCDGEDYELLFAVAGGTGVPKTLGRQRTSTTQVGFMRAMPRPDAPRVIGMLDDVELAMDRFGCLHETRGAR
jgi:thiamine-monophosphate kinase